MTEAELLAAVDAYLAKHLDAEFWDGVSETERAAAVNMALEDVLAQIPGLTLAAMKAGTFAVSAVAEQAVYLMRNYANLTEGKVVTGESIEGISNTYALIGSPGLSFRAAAFIKRAKSLISGASVHISRG